VDYATLEELRGLNANTLIETTSGDCNMTNLKVVRYNTITQQHEVGWAKALVSISCTSHSRIYIYPPSPSSSLSL